MENRLEKNLLGIQGRVAAAAEKSGRNADAVTLVAVTKYVNLETTGKLLQAGHFDLGESRPQVLWDKAEALQNEPVRWHMIGHLQRNKVGRTLPFCRLIHSVDSLRLMKAIETAAGKLDCQCECLLEVNISGESAKHGFRTDEMEAVLEQAATMQHVVIRGLMGMASLSGDLAANQREFARLREIRDGLPFAPADNIELEELSMGMSGDFEQAIEEGATIVRVGSVLFEGVENV